MMMAESKPYKGKCKCFLVWSPEGNTEPKRVHPTHKSALREAYRLASIFPGQEFFVLMQASKACVAEDVKIEETA